jgi:hypothetical protein
MREKFNLFNGKRIRMPDYESFTPNFYRIYHADDREKLEKLIESDPDITVFDTLYLQLSDLMRCRYPRLKSNSPEMEMTIFSHLNQVSLEEYGVWVYYPWSKKLVHLLDEEEFIEVRTNRNLYKISKEERAFLSGKKIGVIGLSIGHAIATTLVMERICGEIRIADFDTLDLSNLNRLNTDVTNLGINKTIITARHLKELDPYIKVKEFTIGINETNLDDFLLGGGKLDLLIEECDSFDIKILARLRSKKHLIPVLMDTNDNGLIDIERFDLQPDRPILHGLLDEKDLEIIRTATSSEDKIPYILKIVEAQKASISGQASLIEVGQTLTSWPQLASSVVLGAGATVNIARRILLNKITDSGRFYCDIDKIIASKEPRLPIHPLPPNEADSFPNFQALATNPFLKKESTALPSLEQLHEIMVFANMAPSVGNDQPWQWEYSKKKNRLLLYHDSERAKSFGNYKNIGSLLSLGACFENAALKALEFGLELETEYIGQEQPSVIAFSITFHKSKESKSQPSFADLSPFIPIRETNRLILPRKEISSSLRITLLNAARSIQGVQVYENDIPQNLETIGTIIGECDKVRLFHSESHHDFFNKEIRWNESEMDTSKDGIDVNTLGFTKGQLAAIEIVKNYEVVDFLNQLNLGAAFTNISTLHAKSASVMVLITVPEFTTENLFAAGRSMERLWLTATKENIGLHALISPIFFFSRLGKEGGIGINEKFVPQLQKYKQEFNQLFHVKEGETGVFLCRLFIAPRENYPKIRRGVEKTFQVGE